MADGMFEIGRSDEWPESHLLRSHQRWKDVRYAMPCVVSSFSCTSVSFTYTSPCCFAVAEILMLNRMIMDAKKALVILPYVSIVAEKAEDLQQKLAPLG